MHVLPLFYKASQGFYNVSKTMDTPKITQNVEPYKSLQSFYLCGLAGLFTMTLFILASTSTWTLSVIISIIIKQKREYIMYKFFYT